MPIDWEHIISLPRDVRLSPWQQEVRDAVQDLRDLTAEVKIRPLRSLVILEVKFGEKKTYHKYWCPQPVLNARASRRVFKYTS